MRIEATESGLQEYYSYLLQIQTENPTQIAVLLPGTERIYDINLKTREIAQPKEITVVLDDHNAETIYFRLPRYFDNMDLSRTTCVIQYVNANKEQCIYAVPFFDIDTFSVSDPETGIDEPMMLLPWRLSRTVAAKAGTVTFSIRFFVVESLAENPKLLFNLNTLTQTLKINPTTIITNDTMLEDMGEALAKDYEQLLNQIGREKQALRWSVLSN